MKISPVILILAVTGQWVQGEDDKAPAGNTCYCGLYNEVALKSEPPLLSKDSLLEVTCDEEGSNSCKDYCLALAELVKPNGPKAICEEIRQAKNLKIHVYSRACADGKWIETGFKATHEICCDVSKPVNCTTPTGK
ncbi:uncharacterized protein LOC111049414 [Nilaparvata lugens]|uniref:uncharacterized protein LOC111049414 n=1 Tax=Nilaparvata lugens TaxID=108931 RepID=UPI00193DD6E0|nr:uncharacterized protein LOC111049414 [Nilaparvata lugens]XP_039284883.1 uncharacterized protein LOC111049414 [Nilaparvata lugens]XP_039284884.1 uncharacterized protein LOC111049414 [Nilaparvata lugens]